MMNTIKKILIPTDFSTSAQTAMSYARRFVGFDKSLEICVLHVMENDTDERRHMFVEQEMKKIEARFNAHAGHSCHCLIKTGDLLENILNTQKSLDIDLILMGTAGNLGKETRTSRLVLEADCTVLIVPEKVSSFQINKITLALDLEEFDNSFDLGIVHDIARWFGAEVHVLTIDNRTDGKMPSDKKVADTLEYYLDTLNFHYSFPKNTDIEKGIEQYILENQIDMLVIFPRNHAKRTHPSEGRLTKLLTLHTRVPLLTVD